MGADSRSILWHGCRESKVSERSRGVRVLAYTQLKSTSDSNLYFHRNRNKPSNIHLITTYKIRRTINILRYQHPVKIILLFWKVLLLQFRWGIWQRPPSGVSKHQGSLSPNHLSTPACSPKITVARSPGFLTKNAPARLSGPVLVSKLYPIMEETWITCSPRLMHNR